MLGAELAVPTLEGEREVEIEAGAQHGDTIRLRGEGLPDLRGGRRGDLHVVAQGRHPGPPRRRAARARRAARRRRSASATIRAAPKRASSSASAAPSGDPARGSLLTRARRAGAGRAARAGAGGVEESAGAGYVEYAIYGPPGELPELPDLEAAAGDGLVAIETTEIPDDWADRWRDFHEPVSVGERLLVRPSWEEDRRGFAGLEIVIDPGRAFGTGAHATTWLCLELLLGLADEGRAAGSLADLGTGSGVLAIAAAKLGCAPVLGCDHEPAAVEIAAANAAANGVAISVERINLREQPAPEAATWVANLTAPVLLPVAERLATAPKTPRTLIASGLLSREVESVSAAFAAAGFVAERVSERGDWVALQMTAG